MTIANSPINTGMSRQIAKQDDLIKTGDKNIRGGPVYLYNLLMIKLTATGAGDDVYAKVYNHNGSGWSASIPAQICMCMDGSLGADQIIECIPVPPLYFDKGLTWAASEDVGDALTTAVTDDTNIVALVDK